MIESIECGRHPPGLRPARSGGSAADHRRPPRRQVAGRPTASNCDDGQSGRGRAGSAEHHARRRPSPTSSPSRCTAATRLPLGDRDRRSVCGQDRWTVDRLDRGKLRDPGPDLVEVDPDQRGAEGTSAAAATSRVGHRARARRPSTCSAASHDEKKTTQAEDTTTQRATARARRSHGSARPTQPACARPAAVEPRRRCRVVFIGVQYSFGVGRRCSRSSTCGPISVTSPAPRVSTRSPGRARSATARRPLGPVRLEDHVRRRQVARRGDERAVDPGLGCLSRRVDVHHDDLVGGTERLPHLGGEEPGPAEQVRLEADDQPAVARRSTRAARRSPAISLGWWA